MTFDPRTISKPVYEALADLRSRHSNDNPRLKDQKNQAVEIHTYLSTWGMLRLKAEERALNQEGKKEVVKKFFQCLGRLENPDNPTDLSLDTLKNMPIEEYLGLTGLGLAVAQEFSFWAMAVYHDIRGEN
jgi:hypothetical protein